MWGKQGVGSNGPKGQCPFQPDDVLAGAERRELGGLEGNWLCRITSQGAVADGRGI